MYVSLFRKLFISRFLLKKPTEVEESGKNNNCNDTDTEPTMSDLSVLDDDNNNIKKSEKKGNKKKIKV